MPKEESERGPHGEDRRLEEEDACQHKREFRTFQNPRKMALSLRLAARSGQNEEKPS